MTSSYLTMGPRVSEIVAANMSGGTNATQAMAVGARTALLDAAPAGGCLEQAGPEANVLETRAYGRPLAESYATRWINTPNRRNHAQSRQPSSRDSAGVVPR
jgi:hypothetical protein